MPCSPGPPSGYGQHQRGPNAPPIDHCHHHRPTHDGAGQTYFWNESTGETTELGEPRPKTRFRDQSFRGANDARFQEGWRELPDRDRTYIYSLIGVAVGITAGWATQFMH